MDGLSAPAAVPPAPPPPAGAPPPPAPQVLRVERMLLLLGSMLYLGYVVWCAGLMALLPSSDGGMRDLVSIGLTSVMVGAAGFVLVGWVALMRISKSNVSIQLRQRSLMKIVLILAPGLLLSGAVPFMITREPSISIDIISPTNPADLIAPVSVTLSVEKAVSILRRLGQSPVKYQWDVDNDGKVDNETVVPITTSLFAHQGAYTVMMHIVFADGSFRRLSRGIIIPRAVFTITPPVPVVEKPLSFSIAQLLTDPKQLDQATWDFGDGTEPAVAKGPAVAHTYFAVGQYPVSVLVQLVNKTQVTLKRTVEVITPPPLPFPVSLATEPQNLIGSAPFGALFRVDTAVPLQEVQWDFGDGKGDRGAGLIRIGHSFETPGLYPVVTRVRSASGQVAEITTIVRVTEMLALNDLHYEGSPDVQGNKLTGEVPLQVNLTPKTSVPLVHFLWEAPEATSATVDGETLHAVYRKEGTYTLTLIGQDADGKVLRQVINVDVRPPAAEPTIMLDPDGGVAPLSVTADASQTFVPPDETLAGFKWLFGDEGQGSNNQAELGAAQVQHVYENPGSYTMTLKAVMASGKEFSIQRTIVVRKPVLSACLTTSRVTVQAGKGVQFDSACSTGNPKSYLWDVRYGAQPDVVLAQSTTSQYIYVFDTPGSYTVTLTIKDQFANEDKKTVAITVTP